MYKHDWCYWRAITHRRSKCSNSTNFGSNQILFNLDGLQDNRLYLGLPPSIFVLSVGTFGWRKYLKLDFIRYAKEDCGKFWLQLALKFQINDMCKCKQTIVKPIDHTGYCDQSSKSIETYQMFQCNAQRI